MKRLRLVLDILLKYKSDGDAQGDDGSYIVLGGPSPDEVFDREDIKILNDNGAYWTGFEWRWM